ncbi:hypothetical protein A6770_14965 [Nostoc minutum NIES-26]|uniref:Uncharacterized protein n=1 Tax=Nostoc minutum NIES-26 TaxID=1844469 RepID=A0A367RKC8_9NOSO|nr:hypothetical protein A6770_14965 [Nostoc minutum NIES-26]
MSDFKHYDPENETREEYLARRAEYIEGLRSGLNTPSESNTYQGTEGNPDYLEAKLKIQNRSLASKIFGLVFGDNKENYIVSKEDPNKTENTTASDAEKNANRAKMGSQDKPDSTKRDGEWHLWADGRMHKDPEPRQEGTGEWYLDESDGKMKRR